MSSIPTYGTKSLSPFIIQSNRRGYARTTCLCTTSNFLPNKMVIMVEMVIMVRMVIMVEMVFMVEMFTSYLSILVHRHISWAFKKYTKNVNLRQNILTWSKWAKIFRFYAKKYTGSQKVHHCRMCGWDKYQLCQDGCHDRHGPHGRLGHHDRHGQHGLYSQDHHGIHGRHGY